MQKSYKYGIELECLIEHDSFSEFLAKISGLPFTISGDGSIESNDSKGIEIKCSKPLGFTQLERATKKLAKICDSYDVTVNSSCGFHVHVSNKRFFNKKYLTRLTKFWCAIEDVLMSTQPQSRYNNRYCKRKLLEFVKDTQDMPTAKSRLIDAMARKDRYYALNFNSLYKHGTIECRLHSATVNANKVLNWTKLLVSIYDYVSSKYDSLEVDALFNSPISDEKVIKVFDLLGLEPDVKAHFLARVQKFGFETLGQQQTAAIKAMEIKPRVEKARKAFQRIEETYNNAQNDLRMALRVFGNMY